MPSILRRVASAVCVLVFAQNAIVLCAGWQATPEMRRKCCQNGACPLHHRENSSSRTAITQAAADNCCAQSRRPESSPSGTPFASTVTPAVIEPLQLIVLGVPAAPPLRAPWETPSPPTHVPKHLLLSVLLV